ncbi:MAG TPA: VacJ family lipoprotein [Burkholderiales bacterium]|nr:VacJ family lipoprotein [Burkholderiales bacterium]
MTHDIVRRTRAAALGLVLLIGLIGGCATTASNPRDPLEPLNRGIYTFNEHVDGLLLRPAAELYRLVLPDFARTGVSNFFSNLNDVIVALNNLLQGKVNYAASDASRVVVNSTIGVLGFIDVATKIGLEKHDEDFGQTLGRWGVSDGPYLVLPFFGPSNFRDAIGRIPDYYADPVTYVDPSRDRNLLWGTRVVNRRAELLGASRVLEAAALDPYEFVRDAYLQRRRNLIYDGNPPREELDDDTDTNGKPADKPEEKKDGKPSAQRSNDEPIRSVLVSGAPLTPAEEEALSTPKPLTSSSITISGTVAR